MAYDEGLADRIRVALLDQPGTTEQKMFGGLTFLINGNMCCGVIKDEFMARVGPQQYDGALSRPHARLMEFTGRPMAGMVMVAPDGVAQDEDLTEWVAMGVRFAGALPPK